MATQPADTHGRNPDDLCNYSSDSTALLGGDGVIEFRAGGGIRTRDLLTTNSTRLSDVLDPENPRVS